MKKLCLAGAVTAMMVIGTALTGYAAERVDMLDMINRYRAEHGVAALEANPEMEYAAMMRAKESIVLYSHDRPDGRKFWTVDEKWVYGENLGRECRDEEHFMELLIASESHRANLLNENFKYVEVYKEVSPDGVTYWAQEFGK